MRYQEYPGSTSGFASVRPRLYSRKVLTRVRGCNAFQRARQVLQRVWDPRSAAIPEANMVSRLKACAVCLSKGPSHYGGRSATYNLTFEVLGQGQRASQLDLQLSRCVPDQ